MVVGLQEPNLALVSMWTHSCLPGKFMGGGPGWAGVQPGEAAGSLFLWWVQSQGQALSQQVEGRGRGTPAGWGAG